MRKTRSYDHRLRELVRKTKNVRIATELGVPRSTAMGWIRPDEKQVVSLDVLDCDQSQLRAEVVKLRRRVQKLRALLRLVAVLLNVSGFSLVNQRLPEEGQKLRVLRAIDRARKIASLRAVLRILGLSSARYHAWRRLQEGCALDDQSSCPRTSPQRLTLSEIRTIKQMVTSPEYRHVPTGTLAILAQRLGKVFASPTTWCRLVREFGWRRPRLRVHPAKPKVGLRTTKPDETWHIDMSIIRLLDGSKAYLHAVIDNFSRRILAWRVAETFSPANSVAILLEAAKGANKSGEPPAVLTDGGIENNNSDVDHLVERGLLRRVLAFVDLNFSNSMIEAWWRILKHQWLFLNTLDSVSTVRRLVAFYVEEHNQRLPHSAFRGQTPDEMYFGTGDRVPEELESGKKAARLNRLESNRALGCEVCDETKESVSDPAAA